MASPISYPRFKAFVQGSNAPLTGGKVYFYAAGTSTPQNTYTDATLTVANANPVILDSNGEAEIWPNTGLSYKIVLQDSTGVTQWTLDNLSIAATANEWLLFGGTPTFINATSFSVTGDQTAIFVKGRRLKTVNTGGTIYSTVTLSAFAAVTTVTVTNDSGTLDAGLSSVSYGIIAGSPNSLPQMTNVGVSFVGTSNLVTATAFELFLSSNGTCTTTSDALGEYDSSTGRTTVVYTGRYLIQAVAGFTQTVGATYTVEPRIEIKKNGGTGVALIAQTPALPRNATGVAHSLTNFGVLSLTAGDYIEVFAQASFSAGTIGFTANGGAQLLVRRIG